MGIDLTIQSSFDVNAIAVDCCLAYQCKFNVYKMKWFLEIGYSGYSIEFGMENLIINAGDCSP